MSPKVSIILPVYNVEPYLRQCLDSVVNQTMRDIQIICVNDGSADGSSAILEEYAAKDPRVEVIYQENRGGGSARNAAYPYIRGKYTYFADPDDWLDLTLCEETFAMAEKTEADLVFFHCSNHEGHALASNRHFPSTPSGILQTPAEKSRLLRGVFAPWWKLIRTEFLFVNDVRFSDGKRPHNDLFAHWKSIVHADKIAILDLTLYYHRVGRPGSYQQTRNADHFIFLDTMQEVAGMLMDTRFFQTYHHHFERHKLGAAYHYIYPRLPSSLHPSFLRRLRESLTADDRAFYRSATGKELLGKNCVRFYRYLVDGGWFGKIQYYYGDDFSNAAKGLERYIRHRIVKPLKKAIKLPERLVRYTIVKPLKARFVKRQNTVENEIAADTNIGNTVPFEQNTDEQSRRSVA